MAYEIDFIPVGDPDADGKCRRSGDAIAVRWGNLSGDPKDQWVMIVDGGFKSSGEALVEHVRTWYKTSRVDFVVNSHPHDDHIQGLFPVFENLSVGTLLIHKPWEHAKAVVDLLGDNRTTYRGSRQRLKESFQAAHDLCELAAKNEVKIMEPFEGASTADGVLRVLGPSVELYQQLIAADLSGKEVSDTVQAESTITATIRALAAKVAETWDRDKLGEPATDAVEPLNHTSTILHLNFGETTALLTGDAGVVALERAAMYAESQGIDLTKCTRVQLPHHGSKRNVGPKILNRILGPILPKGTPATRRGMLSAAIHGEPKHPSARVTNGFLRRGFDTNVARASTICWSSHDAPDRPRWTTVPTFDFRYEYEEGDV